MLKKIGAIASLMIIGLLSSCGTTDASLIDDNKNAEECEVVESDGSPYSGYELNKLFVFNFNIQNAGSDIEGTYRALFNEAMTSAEFEIFDKTYIMRTLNVNQNQALGITEKDAVFYAKRAGLDAAIGIHIMKNIAYVKAYPVSHVGVVVYDEIAIEENSDTGVSAIVESLIIRFRNPDKETKSK